MISLVNLRKYIYTSLKIIAKRRFSAQMTKKTILNCQDGVTVCHLVEQFLTTAIQDLMTRTYRKVGGV